MVERHDKDLYRGNGKPGLTTRMEVCEERQEDMREDIQAIVKNQVWATRFTIATFVGLAVNIFIMLVKK